MVFVMLDILTPLDDSRNPKRMWPPAVERLVLSPKLIVWCLDNGYAHIIPSLAKAEIKDKSKADHIVKTIASVQAAWFCCQFLTRIAQRLPVTLLELNTFAHSLCALLIYTFWWDKPLDVDEPILISTTQDEQLCAAATMHSHLGFYKDVKVQDPNVSGVVRIIKLLITDFELIVDHCSTKDVNLRDSMFLKKCIKRTSSPVSYSPGDFPDNTVFRELDTSDSRRYQFISTDPPLLYLTRNENIPGTTLDVQNDALEIDQSLLARLQQGTAFPHWEEMKGYELRYEILDLRLSVNSGAWFSAAGSFSDSVSYLDEIFALIVSGLCYGGLHALAYGLPLNSQTETILWQISCIAVASFGFVFLFFRITGVNFSRLEKWIEEKSTPKRHERQSVKGGNSRSAINRSQVRKGSRTISSHPTNEISQKPAQQSNFLLTSSLAFFTL